MNIEIERKFEIQNKEQLVNWLDEHSGFVSENSQEDILFEQEDLSDRKILRLRKENSKQILTFKELIFKDDNFHHCDELEAEFKKDNLEEIFKIISIAADKDIAEIKKEIDIISNLEKSLNSHGFKSTYIINKVRRNYKYDSIQLSLDVVKNLGTFIELEHLNPTSYEAALNDFNVLLSQIKTYLGNEVEKGYLDLLKEELTKSEKGE
ncbi:MAG: CYTH domain-containing protein [Proteobacteria bacterium]|nr:CYTH domain-containing protein [Pseudomonadota bacterium]